MELTNNNGILINTNGDILNIMPEKEKFSLEELQNYVKGYIEYYPVKFDFHKAIINEEGLIYGMKFNQKAAAEYGILAVGPVLIIPDAFLDLE